MHVDLFRILAVGAGGYLGGINRYMLSVSVEDYFKASQFPIGIATVNIIGLLAGLFELKVKDWMNVELRLFLFVRFLGGFTTFSSFTSDTILFRKDGEVLLALLNVGARAFKENGGPTIPAPFSPAPLPI